MSINKYSTSLWWMFITIDTHTHTHTRPSIAVDSASVDWINCGLNIRGWGTGIPENSKKKNLKFPYTGNYLSSIFIVLGIVHNLDMI